MKILYLFTILLITFGELKSEHIDEQTALKVAQNFMTAKADSRADYAISSLSAQTLDSLPLFYIVNFKEPAFVIVSADDAVVPVLAYNFNSNFDINDIEEATQDLLWFYKMSIADVKKTAYKNSENTALWENALLGIFEDKGSKSVSNLLKTEWGQRASNDRIADCDAYNHYITANADECNCYSTTGTKCAAGCVAAALGQIMRYWAHPVETDFAFYDWCNIPNVLLKSSDPDYLNHRNNIARLLKDIGYRVGMAYCGVSNNTCSSSASDVGALTGLVQFFEYDNAANLKHRLWNDDDEWIQMLKDELDENRPVYYAGSRYDKGRAGHAFVCSGYDNSNRFWFNFGWNSKGNGFYYISNIFPSTVVTSAYNYSQSAIFNIKPKEEDKYSCSSTIIEYQFYEGLSPLFYFPYAGTIIADDISISSGLNVNYKAYENIELSNFEVASGAEFIAEISRCPSLCGDYVPPVKQLSKNLYGSLNENQLYINDETLRIYPNPADTEINIAYSGTGTVQVQLYDVFGRQVYAGNTGRDTRPCVSTETGNIITINTAAYPPGVYLLRVSGSGVPARTEKIVIAR